MPFQDSASYTVTTFTPTATESNSMPSFNSVFSTASSPTVVDKLATVVITSFDANVMLTTTSNTC